MRTIGYIILMVLFVGCNPVKRVLKDPEKLTTIFEEMTRRGYCVNDTITSIDTVYVDTTQSEIITVFADPDSICQFDTVLKSGTRVALYRGVLYVDEKPKIIKRTITNNIRDKKYEEILQKDIKSYKDTLAAERLVWTKVSENYKQQIEEEKHTANKYLKYLIGIIILICGLVVYRIINTIKPL